MKPKAGPKKLPATNFSVPREALMTYVFASKEDHRTNLKTIHFERGDDDTIHSITTDGYRLIHLWWKAAPDDVLEQPFEIESEAVEFLFRELNGKGGSIFSRGKDRTYRVLIHEGAYYVGTDQEEFLEVGKIEPAWASYPPWKNVMPKRAEPGPTTVLAEFGLDLDLLFEFYKYLGEFSSGAKIKLNYGTPGEGPILFVPYLSNEEVDLEFAILPSASVEYILMPTRV